MQHTDLDQIAALSSRWASVQKMHRSRLARQAIFGRTCETEPSGSTRLNLPEEIFAREIYVKYPHDDLNCSKQRIWWLVAGSTDKTERRTEGLALKLFQFGKIDHVVIDQTFVLSW
jgi:hypothetical protein